MRTILVFVGAVLVFAGAGCQQTPLSGVPQPKQEPLEMAVNAANDTVGSGNDALLAVAETLECIGNKFDDFTDFAGEVAQSL